ncbi:hypothetical protein D9M72_635330 [compost metagenome]
MVPARERFDAYDLKGVRTELWLEMRDEFLVFQTAKDLVGGLFGLEHGGLQIAGEGFVPVATAAFGLVKGDIGIDEDLG